ncbi:MAG: preprotein translocase subunit SecE [Clostridia bacterium]|nr:preprotein translocase subunit SecE [Clostridia bacterium]
MAKQASEQKAKKGNGFFARAGRWIKSIFIELKKVTWPKMNTVVKQLLVVLGVTVAFLILLIGVDSLLGLVFDWFTGVL